MKTNSINLVITIFIAIIIFTGCKKEALDNDYTSAKDDALAQQIFDNISQISDEAYSLKTAPTKPGSGIIGSCATLNLDTITVPHVLTIDFGTTNCLCNDNKYRRGSIAISFSGHYRDSGSYHSTTFNNYFVNDNQVLGTRTRVNNGKNNAGNYTITYNVSNASIILANNAGTISWAANITTEWIAGHSTQTWIDDVYLITGSSNGTRLNGTAFTKTITSALRKEMICPNIVSGTVDVVRSNKPNLTIDFGSGNCDNIATVTVNGTTFTINI